MGQVRLIVLRVSRASASSVVPSCHRVFSALSGFHPASFFKGLCPLYVWSCSNRTLYSHGNPNLRFFREPMQRASPPSRALLIMHQHVSTLNGNDKAGNCLPLRDHHAKALARTFHDVTDTFLQPKPARSTACGALAPHLLRICAGLSLQLQPSRSKAWQSPLVSTCCLRWFSAASCSASSLRCSSCTTRQHTKVGGFCLREATVGKESQSLLSVQMPAF